MELKRALALSIQKVGEFNPSSMTKQLLEKFENDVKVGWWGTLYMTKWEMYFYNGSQDEAIALIFIEEWKWQSNLVW